MPIKKLKSAGKKVKKVAKATYKGFGDHGREVQAINKEAEKNVGKSGSRREDVKRQAKEAHRIKKERGVSLKNSIKKRLK